MSYWGFSNRFVEEQMCVRVGTALILIQCTHTRTPLREGFTLRKLMRAKCRWELHTYLCINYVKRKRRVRAFIVSMKRRQSIDLHTMVHRFSSLTQPSMKDQISTNRPEIIVLFVVAILFFLFTMLLIVLTAADGVRCTVNSTQIFGDCLCKLQIPLEPWPSAHHCTHTHAGRPDSRLRLLNQTKSN